jgi:hypothetical protein
MLIIFNTIYKHAKSDRVTYLLIGQIYTTWTSRCPEARTLSGYDELTGSLAANSSIRMIVSTASGEKQTSDRIIVDEILFCCELIPCCCEVVFRGRRTLLNILFLSNLYARFYHVVYI